MSDFPFELLVWNVFLILVNSSSIVCNFVGESSANVEDNEADRRAGFVNSLLNVDVMDPIASANLVNSPLQEICQKSHEGNESSAAGSADLKVKSMFTDFPNFFPVWNRFEFSVILNWQSNMKINYEDNYGLVIKFINLQGCLNFLSLS